MCKWCTKCALWCRDFAQYVTVTHSFLYMPATAEEELKKFYFTAFGAWLQIEQTTTTKVNGVLPLSGNCRLHVHACTVSFPLLSNVLGKMSLLHWLPRTKTHSKAKNMDSDESSSSKPVTKPEKLKTEMTASVQQNKSNTQEVKNERFLMCTRQNNVWIVDVRCP